MIRPVVASAVLVAFLGGVGAVRPCVDDDECAMSCTMAATMVCPVSDQHQDPHTPNHFCDCLCHVPGVVRASRASIHCDALVEPRDVPMQKPEISGFPDSPFRPPRS